jgi:hypothetical protein
LKYKECCIEATSSATDTWLSTGYPKMKIQAGTATIQINGAGLQHFTSTPQSDSTTVTAVLSN